MKKILAICLSLALLATCVPTVFATEDTCAGTGEAEIRCCVYSSYTISMPALVDLGTQSYSDLFSAQTVDEDVTIIDANIAPGYKVDVYVTNLNESGYIEMTNMLNPEYTGSCVLINLEEDAEVTASIPLVTFYDTELEYIGTLTKSFRTTMGSYSLAGDYTGTMTYSFSCNPY